MWFVYLLYNKATHRTYIGCTTDYKRRLRQHNREIKGGASSTAKGAGHWVLYKVLSGFSDRSVAYRWEKLLKSRARGYHARLQAFNDLPYGICPNKIENMKWKYKQYVVPSGIEKVNF